MAFLLLTNTDLNDGKSPLDSCSLDLPTPGGLEATTLTPALECQYLCHHHQAVQVQSLLAKRHTLNDMVATYESEVLQLWLVYGHRLNNRKSVLLYRQEPLPHLSSITVRSNINICSIISYLFNFWMG